MKVLQINAVNGIGSTGRTCDDLLNHLNKSGHEGFVAYSTGLPSLKGYNIGSKLDVKLHGLFSRLFGLQAYFSQRSTRKLLDYISDLNPDIIHLRNLHSNYINLNLLTRFLAINDIPTVVTLHDCWFYTGKCTHYTVDKCYKWKIACGGCPRLKKDNPSWFFDRTNKMLKDKKEWLCAIPRLAVVGVSDWITSEVKQSILSSAKIITRIYNWVDLDIFKPIDASKTKSKLGLDGKFVILGVASGWSNAKGLDKFLELSDVLPEDMQIVLVGNISKNIILPDNIKEISSTHNVEELVSFYSMANVYLHLSLEETFGKTIAEAMACGTPAIVLNSTACPEVVGGDGGIVIDRYSESAILQAADIIRSNPDKYSAGARKRVVQNFNSEKLMNDHLALYQKLLDIHVV